MADISSQGNGNSNPAIETARQDPSSIPFQAHRDLFRGMSLSEGDLSTAQNDMDEQMAYTYMLLKMTSDPEHTDELLYKYLNTFTSFTGIQLPAFVVRALFEVQLIAKETNSTIFAQFMATMIQKLNNTETNPAKFYALLGKNLCHLGTALRTMSAVLADQGDGKDYNASASTRNPDTSSPEESDGELYSEVRKTEPAPSGSKNTPRDNSLSQR